MSGSVKRCGNSPVCFQDRAARDAGKWSHKKAVGKGEHLTAHTARGTGGLPGHRRLGDWEGLGNSSSILRRGMAGTARLGYLSDIPDVMASSVSPTGISWSYLNLNGQCFSKFIQRV